LKAFLAEHAAPNGEGARVLLHAGEAAQPAIVSLHPAHRPADMTPRYKVHWEAERHGPYPVFDGELTVGADEDYDAFWLVLDGSYAPPGGIVGEVFDAVIGHRIAMASARSLLTDMRTQIEARFAAQELAKRS
jgi:hypothetical protein